MGTYPAGYYFPDLLQMEISRGSNGGGNARGRTENDTNAKGFSERWSPFDGSVSAVVANTGHASTRAARGGVQTLVARNNNAR